MLRKYLVNDRGNVSLIAAAAMIPIAGVAGMALDMMRAHEAKDQIQVVADSAVLSAVLATGSDEDRRNVGLEFAGENWKNIYGVEVDPSLTVNGDTAEATLGVRLRTTIARVLFTDGEQGVDERGKYVEFTVKAKAVVTPGEEHDVCVLALNPSMADAIYLRGTGDFTAENCEAHSDSSSNSAIHRQGAGNASAKAFTTVGGYQNTGGGGSLTPGVEEDQETLGDPFGSLSIPSPPAGAWTNVSAHNTTRNIAPGKYGNLTAQTGGTIVLAAGIYYINGTISFSGNSPTIDGSAGVTLILQPGARLDLGSQGTLKLKAQTAAQLGGNDQLQGIAVIQKTANAGLVHNLTGGASGFIKGVWYTPKAKLNLVGNAEFNANSSYAPVIVDNFEIGGTGAVHVKLEASAEGFEDREELVYSEPTTARLTQ